MRKMTVKTDNGGVDKVTLEKGVHLGYTHTQEKLRMQWMIKKNESYNYIMDFKLCL